MIEHYVRQWLEYFYINDNDTGKWYNKDDGTTSHMIMARYGDGNQFENDFLAMLIDYGIIHTGTRNVEMCMFYLWVDS